MTLFQSIFVPTCLLAVVLVLWRTLRGSVGRRSGLFWASVWLAAAILIADPAFTTVVAHWFGIGRGADLVLYLAVLAGLGLALFFYGRQRRLETLLTGLMRREALRASRHGGSDAGSAP